MNLLLPILLAIVTLFSAVPLRAEDPFEFQRWTSSSSPNGKWILERMQAQPMQKVATDANPANLAYLLKDLRTGKIIWAGTEYQDNSGGTPPLFCWSPDSTSCVVVDRLGRGEVKILTLSIDKKVIATSFDPGREITRLVTKAKGDDALGHSLTIVFYDNDFRWTDPDHCEGSIEGGQSDLRWRLFIQIAVKPQPAMTILRSNRLDHTK
jgi:hypothetical protein